MQKKKLIGLIGLALVVMMTVFAYFLPGEASAESSAHSDIIRVRVYDQYPSVTINSPVNESVTVSPAGEISFDYENSSSVKMSLTHEDEEGNVSTTELPTYTPDLSDLDPEFQYGSGSATVAFNLDDYDLGYGRYTLTLESISPVGYDTQSVEFYYLPVKATQTGASDDNNDPTVLVEYDSGVAKIEVMPVDSNGNPLFDEPIVIEVPSPYEAGSKEITLPFSSYGLASGDYTLSITAYTEDSGTGQLAAIVLPSDVPADLFKVSYTQPDAPAIPNTGRLLGNLGVSSSDLVITAVLVFAFTLLFAFVLLGHKKKDYRKNLRSRK
ncbi:hypothetical protein IJI72_02595 [Candidatus Saccharibacteria bacterium]|nr:hypothetical protein [Candidatus Saccharibacteria bacterium]